MALSKAMCPFKATQSSSRLAVLNSVKLILAVLLHKPADEVTGSRGLSCKDNAARHLLGCTAESELSPRLP